MEHLSKLINKDGSLRKDSEHVLKGEHTGPRNEEEARYLRDPNDVAASLLANFQWDNDDESGEEAHLSYPDCVEILTEMVKMMDDIKAGLSIGNFESSRFTFPLTVSRYPYIDGIFNGPYSTESKAAIMDMIVYAFAGRALSQDGYYDSLSKTVNEIMRTSDDSQRKYVVSQVFLRDESFAISVSDTFGSDKLQKDRQLVAEVVVRVVLHEKVNCYIGERVLGDPDSPVRVTEPRNYRSGE